MDNKIPTLEQSKKKKIDKYFKNRLFFCFLVLDLAMKHDTLVLIDVKVKELERKIFQHLIFLGTCLSICFS